MNPADILKHHDQCSFWTHPANDQVELNMESAYECALAVRTLRIARGERARGFKIGFTNRNIWDRYNVTAPIWGTIYDTTVSFCDESAAISIANSCQPRIEPEAVFGMRDSPAPDATLDDLFNAIDWIAPGFEIVQSHREKWKFNGIDSILDGGLHAHLLIGRKISINSIAATSSELDIYLSTSDVILMNGKQVIEKGFGSCVLGSPLQALHHFLKELRQCPLGPDLIKGDVVTTGTWTDAWPVNQGQSWSGLFNHPLGKLEIKLI